MADLIGQSLGRYQIQEQLGEGGMATVYKAFDTRLETDVAVKVIRTENILPSALDRALKRFEREAKALARLMHPNIVKVTDYGEYDGKPYLIMPFLPGGTLKQRLGNPVPWQQAVQILMPIAEALDYAHSQNMVHRDVKPSNILLTERGQPMLTDFGIAKILDLEETMDLTGTSAAIGTPEYMAPEQMIAKNADHRADIYALGIVLYEMITGRKPYTADTPMAVLIMHARDPLPSPRKYQPALPDNVEKVLLKALAKDPADRYQSMAEFGQALQRLFTHVGKKFADSKKAEKSASEHPKMRTAEEVASERAKVDARKGSRANPERQTVQKVAFKERLSRFFPSLHSAKPKANLFIRIAGIMVIILVLLGISSLARAQFPPLLSLKSATVTPTSSRTATATLIHSSPTPAKTTTPVLPFATPTQRSPRRFSIFANKEWFDTNIVLKPNQKARVAYVSGTWSIDRTLFESIDGNGYQDLGTIRAEFCNNSSVSCEAPSDDTVAGTLVARVGDVVIVVGNSKEVSTQLGGGLLLMINDLYWALGDNSGYLRVDVTLGE